MNQLNNVFKTANSPQPTLAVVVPVYNISPYIRQCFDSLLAQTYPYWVAYVIDDGSTDESSQIVDEYAIRDSRFRVFHKLNEGVSSARNFGLDKIEKSGEKYISVGFLDGDDWLEPETYAEVIAVIREYHPDVLFHGYSYIYPDRKQTPRFIQPRGLINRSAFLGAVFNDKKWKGSNGSFGNVWTKYINPSLLDGSLRFIEDREVIEDGLFNTQLAIRAQNFYFCDKAYYNYRQRDGSLMHGRDFIIRVEKGFLKALKVVKESSVPEKKELSFKIRHRMLIFLFEAEKRGSFLFLKDSLLFSYIAKEVLDIAVQQKNKKKLTESQFRFIASLAIADSSLFSRTLKSFPSLKYSKIYRLAFLKYLKYKVLSKLSFGDMRLRYRDKYQEQKRIYCAIKKGRF
ncbi:MAG: glycosyltransferase [Oxalobacter sp.]|nr:glycosyltransferase [Oxalobacter sp.]